MMFIDDTSYLYLLLISSALLIAAAGIAVIRFQYYCQRIDQFWNSPTGSALADEQKDHARRQLLVNMRLEKRLADLQGRLIALAEGQTKPRTRLERQLPIDNAVRMARSGASIEDLTRICGLNMGEARLMLKMHRPDVAKSG